jgi:hypothetical protein
MEGEYLIHRVADELAYPFLESCTTTSSVHVPFRASKDEHEVAVRELLACASLLPAVRPTSGLPPARIHDLRHTFAVHCAHAGVPLPRLQKLLGHSSPLMTMRYMKHAPEAYFAEDAARVAASLTGAAKPAVSEGATAPSAPVIRLA